MLEMNVKFSCMSMSAEYIYIYIFQVLDSDGIGGIVLYTSVGTNNPQHRECSLPLTHMLFEQHGKQSTAYRTYPPFNQISPHVTF